MLYDRNIELTDFLPRFNRALAAAPRQTEGTVVELALTVDAPGELFVENNLARIEARADLSLTGTADQPVLAGRIEALDGEIYLRGRDLRSARRHGRLPPRSRHRRRRSTSAPRA